MEHKPTFYEKYTKRAMDVILSGCALVVLSPVLGVTALGDTLRSAVDSAYAAARKIHFDGVHMRSDIGSKDC